MPNDSLQIVLADDHALVRGGLSLMIKATCADADIIEAGDYQETLKILANEPSIDLLLMDLMMPGAHGIDSIAYIRNTHPDVPVAVISVKEDSDTIRRALAVGTVGYIPKTSSPNVTTSAIQLILSGGIYVPPHVLRSNEMNGQSGPPERPGGEPIEPDARMLGVTPRQKEVLDLLASGKPNKDIAVALGLTPGTVKMHTSRIFKLLNVSNRTEAVARYTKMKRGLERL